MANLMLTTDPQEIVIAERFDFDTAPGDYAHILIENGTGRTLYVYGNKDMGCCFDLWCEVGELFKPYFKTWHENHAHRIALHDQDGQYHEFLQP